MHTTGHFFAVDVLPLVPRAISGRKGRRPKCPNLARPQTNVAEPSACAIVTLQRTSSSRRIRDGVAGLDRWHLEEYSGRGLRRGDSVVGKRQFWLISIALMALVSVPPVTAQPNSVVVVGHLNDVVSPASAQYVHRLIGAADEQRAALLVLIIDTPGGLDTSMRQIVQDLLNGSVPSVAYVAPSGARAASAGVFIAQASNLLAMAPGTNIGAAHPIQGGGQDIPGDLREKITNDAAAYVASIARQRGRDDTWVQEAVRQSVSLTADQAVAQHVADLEAPDLSTLLAQADGRTVTTAAGSLTISVARAEIRSIDPDPVELVAQKAFNPDVAYLLMTVGFLAILIELFHPGALVPGVTGVVCLVIAFVGFAALPMNWGGIVLILAAAALFVLDIKAAAHGGLTIAGLVCFIVGSLLLYSPGGVPSPTLPQVSVGLPPLIAAASAGALFSVVVVRTAVRLSGRPPISGSQRLNGAAGIARSPLQPGGTVTVGGQVWSARLRSGRLEAGRRVRVLGRTGLVLEVEPADATSPTERNGARP
jgi:membrane-bound serine protease (ClpP class)